MGEAVGAIMTGSGEGFVRAVQSIHIACDAGVKEHSEWFNVDQV